MRKALRQRQALLGVDVGGTFTDFFLVRDGQPPILVKLPTDPRDPGAALLTDVARLEMTLTDQVVHGTTVATNAVLERKGAHTALVTTEGFGDLLEIGRQTRPKLYDLCPSRPEPLVPRRWRFEVKERLGANGRVLLALNSREAKRIADQIARSGVESVALCLLFSFLDPRHEQMIGAQLRKRGLRVSLSSEVLPEYREYERASTVTLNAYVAPLMERYLERLGSCLKPRLRIMQSNGGSISPSAAAREAARTVLSGPAAGVVGAFAVARQAGFKQVITFDMGGTSTDVSLCDGGPSETTEWEIAGCPVRLPAIDIHTVGAGGGSIARLDEGGALRVGPESARADPGPVCYGKGDQLTVTDANLILGRLNTTRPLGGSIELQVERTERAMRSFAQSMGYTATTAAEGIIRVANATMEAAIRAISINRGHDPRDYTLVAFGGAGPLHACELAGALRISRVLVPAWPGVLSAFGMVVADVVKDYSRTVMLSAAEVTTAQITAAFHPLERRGYAEMKAEGFRRADLIAEPSLDLRYRGQAYEVNVLLKGDFMREFHRRHQQRYGHNHPEEQVEIVNLRLRLHGRGTSLPLTRSWAKRNDARAAITERKTIIFAGRPRRCPVYERSMLSPGAVFSGPALVTQFDSTTALPPGWLARVDRFGNLVLSAR